MQELQILLIEDNPGNVRYVRELLDEATWFHAGMVHAGRLEEGIEQLKNQRVDVVLLDLNLPDSKGVDTFKSFQQAAGNVPWLVLAGGDDELMAMEAMQYGARDYLIKGRMDSEKLQRTILYALRYRDFAFHVDHLNLVLQTVRNVNRLIAKEGNNDRLMRKICNQLVEIRGYENAWIVQLDEHGKVRNYFSDGPLAKRLGDEAPVDDQIFISCMTRALESDDVVVFTRINGNCRDCFMFREDCHQSVMASRLAYNGKVYGVLWVNLPEAYAKQSEEQQLFREISKDLTFALYRSECEEKRRTEELARKASEQQYQHLFDTLPVGLYISKPDGTITHANDSLVKLLGYPDKQTLINVVVRDLYADKKERTRWNNLIKSELKVSQFETLVRRYDGRLIWIRENTRAIVDEVGQILHYEGSMEDIHFRKKNQERKAFQSLLLRSVNQAIIATDPGGVILYWNAGAESFYGWKAREVMGKNINQVTVPDMSEEEAVEIMHSLRKGFPWRGEFNVQHRDGRIFPAIVSNSPAIDEEGQLAYIIGVSTDIAYLKETESQLRIMNRALRVLSRCNQAIHQAEDEDTLLQFVCDTIIQLGHYRMAWVGYADHDPDKTVRPVAFSGEEVGYLEAVFISWGHRKEGRGPTGKAIRTGKISICREIESDPKFHVWQKEALQRHYGSSLALPLELDDRIIGALNIYASESNAFDEEELSLLTELSNDLSRGIAAVRRKHQQEELHQQLKKSHSQMEQHQKEMEATLEKARESEKLKSTFLANLSHEIRTPMNAILGFTELLFKDEMASQRQQQYMDVIHAKGRQSLRIIDDIVNISRIQSDQLENNPHRFNLNELFSELEQSYRRQLEDQQKSARLVIRMKTSMVDDRAFIRLDSSCLEQVLIHLINNALKFTSEGFVEAGYLPYNSNQLLFYVQDTGLGIAKEKQALIFELFRQANEDINISYGGIGLGLTIAKKLVEFMGGSIWVESEPAKGSTFFFTTPLESANGDNEFPLPEGATDDTPETFL